MLSWNVRGFANKRSYTHMRELLRRFKPDMVFVFETHTQSSTARNYWDKEGYSMVVVEEAQGHSGGIWVLKNDGSNFTCQVLSSMHQCITLTISRRNRSWACSGVYASPVYSRRCLLWNHLRGLRGTITLPWALMGDFNEILSPSEQQGGDFSSTRAVAFATAMDDCNLVDLEFFGSKFMWQKKCVGGRLISRRLDRGIGDLPWRLGFPEASVEHLTRKHSDHNPLLLRCYTNVASRKDRPFGFQAAWCAHEDYMGVVQEAWGGAETGIVQSLCKVRDQSIIFNKEVFGNIFAKKKELEARLRGIQRTLENIDFAQLVRLQKELLADYEDILFKEETYWFQKSRENWIKLGSRNTSFFHAQTVIRRKRNNIHGLFLPSGTWCNDPDMLQNEAVAYYKELFGSNPEVVGRLESPNIGTLSLEAKQALVDLVTKEEVHRALMGMKSYKAPCQMGSNLFSLKCIGNMLVMMSGNL